MIVGIPSSFDNNILEEAVWGVVPECEIQACHRLRVKERIIVKLSTGKTPSISRGIKKAQVARSYRVGFF